MDQRLQQALFVGGKYAPRARGDRELFHLQRNQTCPPDAGRQDFASAATPVRGDRAGLLRLRATPGSRDRTRPTDPPLASRPAWDGSIAPTRIACRFRLARDRPHGFAPHGSPGSDRARTCGAAPRRPSAFFVEAPLGLEEFGLAGRVPRLASRGARGGGRGRLADCLRERETLGRVTPD